MNAPLACAVEIVKFWQDAGPDRWFKKDTTFDDDIRRRFLPTHEAAAAGKLMDWEQNAESTLALLILLDQFPRNMFRGGARSFATDPVALATTARAIVRGFDSQVPAGMRQLFYLPFQHSENLADQEHGVALYRATGDDNGLKWAEIHADIIRRFGRFPHRNTMLGRVTTPEEKAFLAGGGFAG
jgi:uncharacterized protein (DUF924 family)